ncbi:putative 4-mercaptohistidine N1-methyltransferase [Akkermansiaceae bacterium]|nr:putative 4-mercaptohistidine N1-methyltransferase [Akkermansiaceae bacterium]
MSDVYEDRGVLADYLLFHYGSAEEILPPDVGWPAGMHDALDFAVRTVSHFSDKHVARGLDLGCAVGRSTFEMTRLCAQVTGIDFSHAFIDAAKILQQGNSVTYARREEAHRTTAMKATAPAGTDLSKAAFMQGDAMHLPEDLGKFDRVHAANLICRLTDPKLLLERLPDLLNPGGELVIATPCTWLGEFTPPEKWPTGDTLAWLRDSLRHSFELESVGDEPFLIRETARKFQWTRSMVSVWRRGGD